MIRITRKNIASVAEAKGCVTVQHGGRVTIRKGRDGVIVSEDGTITRLGLDLAVTKKMTVAEAAAVLGL